MRARAKSICFACPVADLCLTHAIETREPSGIWGGMDEDTRAVLYPAPPTTIIACRYCGCDIEVPTGRISSVVDACDDCARIRRSVTYAETKAAIIDRCPLCGTERSYRIEKCGVCTRSGRAPDSTTTMW